MRILEFRNTPQLLQKMEDINAVKANKANFYFHKDHAVNWNEKAKDAKETPFNQTTICAIPITQEVNNTLFVIDCDNLFSANFIINAMDTLNVKTLITKSNFGAHIYFIDPSPVAIKAVRQEGEGDALAIDFFNAKTHSSHLVIDGFANPYYHKVAGDEPAMIPSQFKEWLLNTFELLAVEHNVGILTGDSKLFKPNRARWENFIAPALKNGRLDVGRVLTAFEYNRENINWQERNNTLNRFAAWAGVCGFFESYEQWLEFVLIANVSFCQYGLYHEELSEDEIKNTICSRAKWERYYFTATETAEIIALKSQNVVNNMTNYLAFNLTATRNSNQFLHITQHGENVKILEILNKQILLKLCQTDSELRDKYLTLDKKGVEIVNESEIKPIKIIYKQNDDKLYTSDKDGITILNPNALNKNTLVADILAGRDSIELISQSEFTELPFMRVFYNNLAPDPVVARKFLHDMSYCLKNNCGLVTLPCFWDIYGGSGKGLVLNTLIDFCFFNSNYTQNTYQNELEMPVATTAPRISVKTFLESKFNSEFIANAVILDEDGFNANKAHDYNKAFASKIKEFAKNEFIRIECKGQSSYMRKNNVFMIRCLNSLINPIPEGEGNTRLYVSECRKTIDDQELTKIFKDKPRIIAEDLPKILKYILINTGDSEKIFSALPNAFERQWVEPADLEKMFKSFFMKLSKMEELPNAYILVEWLELFFDINANTLFFKKGIFEALDIVLKQNMRWGMEAIITQTISLIMEFMDAEAIQQNAPTFQKQYKTPEGLFAGWLNTYNDKIVVSPLRRQECISLLKLYGMSAKYI